MLSLTVEIFKDCELGFQNGFIQVERQIPRINSSTQSQKVVASFLLFFQPLPSQKNLHFYAAPSDTAGGKRNKTFERVKTSPVEYIICQLREKGIQKKSGRQYFWTATKCDVFPLYLIFLSTLLLMLNAPTRSVSLEHRITFFEVLEG